MLYLTFFSAITLLVAIAINLSEINPFEAKELPMLEQIDAVMAKSTNNGGPKPGQRQNADQNLPLAA